MKVAREVKADTKIDRRIKGGNMKTDEDKKKRELKKCNRAAAGSRLM